MKQLQNAGHPGIDAELGLRGEDKTEIKQETDGNSERHRDGGERRFNNMPRSFFTR